MFYRRTTHWIALILIAVAWRCNAVTQLNLAALGVATQSDGSALAARAIDGNVGTFSITSDVTNSFWEVDLTRKVQMSEVGIVVPAPDIASNLVLRVFDLRDQTIFQATVSNVGADGTWSTNLPAGIYGRSVRFGLENGQANGEGNHKVVLSEVQVFGDASSIVGPLSTTNIGAGKLAYMTRDSDTLPANSNVNDNNLATVGGTSGVNTHDFYWEMNLGRPYALYDVQIITATGDLPNLTNATLTILDKDYNDLCFMPLTNAVSETCDVPLPAPVFGQYVRVSFEYAQRSGGIGSGASWLLDMKEVQAFGLLTNQVGLLNFTATATQIVSSAATTLQWQESDLNELDLYPNYGSVGSNTLAGGTGSLTLSPTNSTEYTLVGFSYSNDFPRQISVEVNGQKLPPQISEFMADNTLTLQDGNNNYSDWIELHNPNNTPLDISGDYLSDDPAAQTKWQFPSGTIISPHGYFVVFADSASANNIYDPSNYLHTSFSLDNDGESLILTGTNGTTVLDGITNFPAQMTDLAYGRTLDGQWAFLEPTPFAPNVAPNYVGWLAPLNFDHTRGWYSNAFTLVISNSNPGATVYWSTNGYEPTNIYTGPLTVANTVGVRAAVKEAGYKSPRIKTHTYLFLNDIVHQSGLSTTITQNPAYTNRLRQGFLDLPILSINVPPAGPQYAYLAYNQDRPERAASAEFFMPDGSNIQQDCGINHLGGQFGTGTGLYAKKTWQLSFDSDYGASYLNFPLFNGFDHGIAAHTKYKELDIHAGNQDQEGYGTSSRGFYMSHAFALDSMLDMGDLNPHCRFVNVFTNGVYMGQFCMSERLTDAMLSQYLGGSKSDYLTVKGNDNTGTWGFIPGVADGPDRSAYDFVRSNMNSYATIKSWVDVTNYVDWMVLWQWGNAESEFRAAMPRAAGQGGFKLWVADADCLVAGTSGSGNYNINYQLTRNATSLNSVSSWGPGWIFSNLMHEANSDFKTLLADRIYKNCFNNGALTPTALTARLDARMAEITNSMVGEVARWKNTYTSAFDPTVWESDAQNARALLFPSRTANLVTYMRNSGWYPSFDPPTLSQYGGSVDNGYQLTVTADPGTIYYTLDGSDPRLPGGGISPNAIAWTSGQSIVGVVNIPLNSTWRYFNTNSAPSGNWTNIIYDDSAWQSGATPAGYPQGDDGVTFGTVLNYGTDSANKWISYYFRQKFVVTNLDGITSMTLGLNVDDGAVVYVNGTELTRGTNMPAGPVSYGTFALTAVSGATETAVNLYNVPANLLVTGTNVIAVEVHQDAVTSTDLHFNLSLFGSVTNNNGSTLTLTLTNATTFNARLWNGTTWSALDSANFLLAPFRQPNPGDLVISELNYHPPDSENYEFVELYNTTTNQLDLTGVQITGGITYLFPNGFQVAPNGFAIAARILASFASRYQATNSPYYYSGLNVAGPYSGKLSNSGDTVTLIASNGVELCSVSYQTSGAWPTRADGNGSSLELGSLTAAAAAGTNIDTYLARGFNWKPSSLYNGSPGRFDTAPQNIVISELLAHTDLTVDWIEFQNLSANPADMSGLYLSDSYSNPLRYYIPANTIVAGNSFLALSTTNFGFAFSEHGESAVLSQVTGTNVIRFVDAVDFPASDDEITFGRYTRSDGIVDFTELRSNTEGTNNDLPRMGPLVASEIMYKPATNFSEFVEFVNISPTNVPLYDPNFPTNTWHVAGGVSFTFPTNQQIAPGQAIIICDTNATTFRAEYGISAGVPVYGPYSGALNNSGDEVDVDWPGVPETNGFVPYYRADHVRYEANSPWTTNAHSGGISLERVTLEAYGNDPINWQSSAVTNGTPGTFVGNRAPIINVIGNTTVYEGDTVLLAAQATDPDQPWQTLTFAGGNLPNNSTFNTNDGTFIWPTVETNGPCVYNLQFIAADNGVHQMITTQIVAVTVLESNIAPWLQAVTNILYPAQIPFTLDLVATDADWPPNILTFGASGLPTGLNLNSVNGQIRGAAQTPGTYPIYYFVSDNGTPSLSASNTFTLTIAQPFVAVATNSVNKFAFQSIAGENYDVQYTLTLSPANWQLLQHITNASGGLINITNVPSTNQCFIRVIWDH